MSTRILIIDDDASLVEMTGIMLGSGNYTPVLYYDGAKAPDVFHEVNPDLVPLDLMLPELDGVEICQLIHFGSGVSIIMLTACTDTQDIVADLEADADDYVTKPFRSEELLAHVSTRLYRTNPDATRHVCAGDFDIDVAGHQAKHSGPVISLTPLEFEPLVTLVRSPWKIFARKELLSQVWGCQYPADTRLVNVHVQRLWVKIEKDPKRPSTVTTVRGVGYRVDEFARATAHRAPYNEPDT